MHAAGRRADENASAAQHHHQRQPLTRPAASTVAFVQPRCACFRLCSEHDVRSFHIRVPSTLRTHHSPWYTYLQKVYREEHIPLPVSLSAFEFFYLALLPVDGQCADSSQTAEVLLPSCASDVCSAWLRNEPASAAEIAEHSLHGTSVSTSGKLPAYCRSIRCAFSRDPSSPATEAQVPVLRSSGMQPTGSPSPWTTVGHLLLAGPRCGPSRLGWQPHVGGRRGVQYGCWFSPSVSAGIFLDVAKALFYRDREALERALPEVRRFPLDRPHILKYRSSAANDSITCARITVRESDAHARLQHAVRIEGTWDRPARVGCHDKRLHGCHGAAPTGCAPRDVG